MDRDAAHALFKLLIAEIRPEFLYRLEVLDWSESPHYGWAIEFAIGAKKSTGDGYVMNSGCVLLKEIEDLEMDDLRSLVRERVKHHIYEIRQFAQENHITLEIS